MLNPFRPGEGKRHAKRVVALLGRPSDRVGLWALRKLSMTHEERDEDWAMDKLGNCKHPSEELIFYVKEEAKDK